MEISTFHKFKPEVVYEDLSLLAVNKPAGIPVIPDRWQPDAPNLRDLLQSHFDRRIWIVHRLDAGTSGIMLFALTAEMHRHLNRLFTGGQVRKTYLALVKGAPDSPNGLIDAPLLEKSKPRPHMIVHPKGKPSQTEYHVREVFQQFSLVATHPLTGRTHQIRVHLAHLGCPLAIDPLYSTGEGLYLSQIKPRYTPSGRKQESPLIARLTLHAAEIAFESMDGTNMRLAADLPKDFRNILNALQKWHRK